MVMRTYFKSILRSVKSNIARFVSIIVIMLLGIAFVAGLGTLSPTIKHSISKQMNADNFSDVIVKSKSATGFTESELDLLRSSDVVADMQPLTVADIVDSYSEANVETHVRICIYENFAPQINTLSIEGELPDEVGEVLVERKSNEIGRYELNSKITLLGGEFTVVGIVSNPQIFDGYGEPTTALDKNGERYEANLSKIVYFGKDTCPPLLSAVLPQTTDVQIRLQGLDERDFFSGGYLDDVDEGVEKLRALLGEEGFAYLTVRENKSYAYMDKYCDKVSVITLIFPVFFIAVSALVVMTTMTRLVEEERPLIGCLKTLGFGDGKILLKYVVLTGLCGGVAGIVGLLVGLPLLPAAIYPAFNTMFFMPPMSARLYPAAGIIAFVAMTAVSLLVTALTCKASLSEKPAELLAAKAPKAGKKIWLERIPFIWRRFSFKYKSSLRNVFRYKKHLWMTVLSVAGSTALVFAGFAILDVADALAVDGGSFVGMKDSISAIAIVVIVFALLLCMFVVYNLTNLNVGERKREIATLDVLGYRSGEILGYIYREIVMMAIAGAICGVGLGCLLVQFVLTYLDFGSLADAQWTAYVGSFALVMLFVVVTDLLLAPKILKIDMTTSLKSNE